MPAAAAVPERMAVGIAQKTANEHMIPIVATVSAATRNRPGIDGIATASEPAATKKHHSAKAHRRSPVRSEWRPTASIATAEAPQGITEIQPIASGSAVI